jgi:hypothetical protein
MKPEQKIVAIGAASGIAAMVVSVWLLTSLLPPPAVGNALAVSTLVLPERLQVVWACVIVFIVARLVFWFGYRLYVLYRLIAMSAPAG